MAQAKRFRFKATRHVVVEGVGHVWPDDADGSNREAGRKVKCVLTAAEAKRYGDDLEKIGEADEDDAADDDDDTDTGNANAPPGGDGGQPPANTDDGGNAASAADATKDGQGDHGSQTLADHDKQLTGDGLKTT